MKASFTANTHVYHDGQRQVPSVTGINRACGLSGSFEFRDKIHAFRGTCVHECSAIIIAGGEPILEPLKPPYSAYENYVKVYGEIPGYLAAMRTAKERIRFTGAIYECPMVMPGSHAGTFDFRAWTTEDQIWDIKSGTWPTLTVVQICAYEDLARRGVPIHEDHPGLPWLVELVRSGRPLKRCGLRLEKTGRFTAYYECPRGRSYDDPMWMNVWRSALYLYNTVPGHEYEEKDEYGRVFKKSMLSDLKWTAATIREQLTGATYDAAMRAGENIFNVRQAYKLL